MVVFSAYAAQMLNAVKFIVKVPPRYPRASASAKRILEVLDTQPALADGRLSEGKPGLRGDIAFHHVSIRYPGAARPVLEDISFNAKQGETVAFIDATGSGKTTLIHLALRLYDVSGGEVLIDGVDVRDYRQEALQGKIGYVPQKAVLFRGTVQDNVAYGRCGAEELPQGAVREALRIAQAEDFVGQLDGGCREVPWAPATLARWLCPPKNPARPGGA